MVASAMPIALFAASEKRLVQNSVAKSSGITKAATMSSGSATTKAQPPASVKGRAALRPAVVLCATLPSAFRCRASAGNGKGAQCKPQPVVR